MVTLISSSTKFSENKPRTKILFSVLSALFQTLVTEFSSFSREKIKHRSLSGPKLVKERGENPVEYNCILSTSQIEED